MKNLIEDNIKAIEAQIAQLQGALQVWHALRDAGAVVTLPPPAETPAGEVPTA